MSVRSLMVAIDFGPESHPALEVAIDLAARLQVPLEIAHTVPPPPLEMTDDPPYVVAARELLTSAATRARNAGIDGVSTVLLQDTVVRSLLDTIEERQPLLVVVGSHGRGGIRRALMGSVSDALARRSPVPVVVVPSPHRKEVVARTAFSCADCGHIYQPGDLTLECMQCGAAPARWLSAPIVDGPVDLAAPAVGESVARDLVEPQTRGTAGLFSTSPPGVEGVDVNPELRVRY